MQYINIYAKSVKRLSCFVQITDEFEESLEKTPHGFINASGEFVPQLSSIVADVEENRFEGGYFYGDATAYEHHLDKVLKSLQYGGNQNSGVNVYNQQVVQAPAVNSYHGECHQPQVMQNSYYMNATYSAQYAPAMPSA